MTLDQRVDKLERDLARTKRTAGCLRILIAAVMGGVAIGAVAESRSSVQSQPVQGTRRVVRANAFVLEDEKGQERAVLDVDSTKARLSLGDERGEARMILGVTGNGPAIFLLDEEGNSRLTVSLQKGSPGITLLDENGNSRFACSLDKDGPRMTLLDQKGKAIAGLSTGETGPVLSPHNKTGSASLAASGEGPAVSLSDEHGRIRMFLMLDEDHGSVLSVTDERGKMIWSAP